MARSDSLSIGCRRTAKFSGAPAGGQRLPRDHKRRQETGRGDDAPHDGNEAKLSHSLDRGDGENRAHDNEDHREWIAAHHPLAVVLDPARANTIKGRSSGQCPTDGLCRGGHHQHRRPQYHGDGNRDGSGNRNAEDIETAHEPMHAYVALAQAAGELERRDEQSNRAGDAVQKHQQRNCRVALSQERVGVQERPIACENDERGHQAEHDPQGVLGIERVSGVHRSGHGSHGHAPFMVCCQRWLAV
jgi:hypothetical protein